MMRIGHGYDVHRLVEGVPLVLGGVTVEFSHGLSGHSDADVLLHAVIDALLGAAAMGDIGRHFSDTDPRYKGISSMILLEEVWRMLKAEGYVIQNLDATVIAERPRLAPYIDEMRKNIARALDADKSCVNVKATSEEGLGFTGNESGMAAHAVVLIMRA